MSIRWNPVIMDRICNRGRYERFGKRREKKTEVYDAAGKIPVIRASICTGEKVAGFKDRTTGKFEDLMLIRNEKDLQAFIKEYGVKETEIQKEW